MTRLGDPPNVAPVAAAFAAIEKQNDGVTQLSVRDTTRASIGPATFTVDYSRRWRAAANCLETSSPYGDVWRTGANSATQFTTSAPITLAGINGPAGTHTLWTLPQTSGAQLIVKTQTGQWGTSYDRARDLGRAPMASANAGTPVERFTISIVAADAQHGTLAMEWGLFRWAAPIVVRGGRAQRYFRLQPETAKCRDVLGFDLTRRRVHVSRRARDATSRGGWLALSRRPS